MSEGKRVCGECSLCCRLPRIGDLDKKANVWCVYCEQGKGCNIYQYRPRVCREYECAWLANPGLADRYRPDLIGLYIASSSFKDTVQVYVDPDRPNSWKEGLGKDLLDHMLSLGVHLIVLVGDDRCVISPPEKQPPLELAVRWQ